MRPDRLPQTVLAAALLLPAVGAGQEGDDSPRGRQYYAVEVVVFDQRGAASDDGERWDVDPALPKVDHPLVGIDGVGAAPELRSLPSDARQLHGIRRKLADTAGYRVLEHLGWQQPGFAEDAGPAVALGRGAASDRPPGDNNAGERNPFADVPGGATLFGTIRVYRGRYLHVELDLRFSPGGRNTAQRADEAASANATTSEPATYPLEQTRRLRSNEIHYIDHPAMGAIVIITPVEGS